MYESPEEILRACVERLGGNKKVGVMLWPELEENPGRAGQKLSDHLNEERREKLSMAQAILIFRKAQQAGFHEGMYGFNRMCGYSASKPLDASEELTRKSQEAIALMEKLTAMQEEMKALMRATEEAA